MRLNIPNAGIAVTLLAVLTITVARPSSAQVVDHSAHMDRGSADTGAVSIEDTGSELIITTPPTDLPVHEDHGEHSHAGVFPPVGTVTAPVSGYLYSFDFDVVDEQGRGLPSNILHHFNIIDPDRRELFLPISHRVLAAGMETGRQELPWLIMGLPLRKGQQLVVNSMLHNPTGQPHSGVSLKIRIGYVSEGRPWPLVSVFPFQIDVAFPAGDKSFDLPPGLSQKSWQGSPSMSGRILGIGSHLHELATHITLEDVTADKTLWTGYPVYREDGTLEAVTSELFITRFGLKMRADHVYRVTVHYDNPENVPVAAGGMGVVAGVFRPDNVDDWPLADVEDDLYQIDRKHYMHEISGPLEQLMRQASTTESEGMEMDQHVHEHDH